eukprot:TRINITY_DN8991_c0_g1_i1.p1 TRINITY_DN8991_c0_g1~~TRINITY_DN8991_c0_g1_i1.p1  ORF type:complete len:121 (-),score=34.44 TRINITY_DN8991_c0_g1_i1:64-426(-)
MQIFTNHLNKQTTVPLMWEKEPTHGGSIFDESSSSAVAEDSNEVEASKTKRKDSSDDVQPGASSSAPAVSAPSTPPQAPPAPAPPAPAPPAESNGSTEPKSGKEEVEGPKEKDGQEGSGR